MTLFNLFRAAACSEGNNLRSQLVLYLNKSLRRKLPFKFYMSEDSTRDRIVLRVEHRTKGTTHTVYIVRKETPKYWHNTQTTWSLDFNMGGSNWHHLKYDLVQFLRTILTAEAPEALVSEKALT